MNVAETLGRLKDIVENASSATHEADRAGFAEAARQFLSGFELFRDVVRETPAEKRMAVVNNTLGGEMFYLTETAKIENARATLAKGKDASDFFGALPLAQRMDFLKILEDKVRAHSEEIATTITIDTSKPIALSRSEIAKGAEWFAHAKENAPKQLTDESKPYGTSLIVGAYNYPYALAIPGIISSLIAGNSVIISPPLKAPDWIFPFSQAVKEAIEEFAATMEPAAERDKFRDVMAGLVQFRIGVNNDLTVGADIVHFVGSDKTGHYIKDLRDRASASDEKERQTILELGGSNIVTVMKSALKLDDAKNIAQKIYDGFAPATGQRCTAPRMIVAQHGAIAVIDELAALCSSGNEIHKIGNPFDEKTKMGALVDEGAYTKMNQAIELAKKYGAKIHGILNIGGNQFGAAGIAGTHYVGPIMLDWSGVDFSKCPEAEKFIKENEIFGPLVHVLPPVKDIDEAVKRANEWDIHKLSGSIFSSIAHEIKKYWDGTQSTSLLVNAAPKDQSPKGKHGNAKEAEQIGGDDNYKLYTRGYKPEHKRTISAPDNRDVGLIEQVTSFAQQVVTVLARAA